MKKLILISLCFVLFIVPFVSADVTPTSPIFGTYKQASNIDLLQTCDNGVSMCTECYISSVKAPDSTILIPEVQMTKRAYDFNYTLQSTYTTSLGTYLVNGYCTDGENMKNWYYSFNVTPAGGAENNTIIFIMLGATALIILILSFIMHNYVFAFISGLLFLGAGVYSMAFGVGSIANDYTRILSVVIIGIGILITVASSLEFVREMAGEGGYGYGGYDDDE